MALDEGTRGLKPAVEPLKAGAKRNALERILSKDKSTTLAPPGEKKSKKGGLMGGEISVPREAVIEVETGRVELNRTKRELKTAAVEAATTAVSGPAECPRVAACTSGRPRRTE